TAGIGQSDSEIVDLVDFPMYVMTSDFGAPSQLEKIDMLDFAELVVLNKYDKRGAEDALRDIRKQWKRNRVAFQTKDEDVPVYPTIASQFNDPGISWMFTNLCRLLREKLGVGDDGSASGTGGNAAAASVGGSSGPTATPANDETRGDTDSRIAAEAAPTGGKQAAPGNARCDFRPDIDTSLKEPRATVLIPGNRARYLAEIAEQGRGINQ